MSDHFLNYNYFLWPRPHHQNHQNHLHMIVISHINDPNSKWWSGRALGSWSCRFHNQQSRSQALPTSLAHTRCNIAMIMILMIIDACTLLFLAHYQFYNLLTFLAQTWWLVTELLSCPSPSSPHPGFQTRSQGVLRFAHWGEHHHIIWIYSNQN